MLKLLVFTIVVLALKLSPNISQVVNHQHKSHTFEQIHLHVAHRQLMQTNIGRKMSLKRSDLMSISTLDFIQWKNHRRWRMTSSRKTTTIINKKNTEHWTYKMEKWKKWLLLHQFFHFDWSTMRMISLVMDFPFQVQLLSWQRDFHTKVVFFFYCDWGELLAQSPPQLRIFKIIIIEHWSHVNGHDSWWIQQKMIYFPEMKFPLVDFR